MQKITEKIKKIEEEKENQGGVVIAQRLTKIKEVLDKYGNIIKREVVEPK